MGVSKELTPIFVLIMQSKALPGLSMVTKAGKPLSDEKLVLALLETIKFIDQDRYELAGKLKVLEKHILDKYGEIYDPE